MKRVLSCVMAMLVMTSTLLVYPLQQVSAEDETVVSDDVSADETNEEDPTEEIIDRDPEDYTVNRLEAGAFEDQNLYNYIRENADADADGIVSLVELEMFSCEFLTLDSGTYSSLVGISSIPCLEYLEINGSFNSYEELRKMTSLKGLSVWNSNFSDLSVLANCKDIEIICTEECPNISDISVCSGFANLRALKLRYCAVSNASALSGCYNLEEVDFTGGRISDFSCLADKKSLVSLEIEGCPVSNLSFLNGLTNLMNLNIRDVNTSSIEFARGMKNLTFLYIDGNHVSDLSPLSGCAKLDTLTTNGNPISDFSAIYGCRNLTGLTMASESITDISFFGQLSEPDTSKYLGWN